MRLLAGLLLALTGSGCALHCHNARTHLLTWYEYVLDPTDRQPGEPILPRVMSEADPALTVGDYVLTDGLVYRVTDQSWDNLPRCSHLYRRQRDPQ